MGTSGVLTAITNYVGGAKGKPDIFLQVGGLFSKTEEHASWARIDLKAGDKVTVKIIETCSVDKAENRYRLDSKTADKNQKAYVRAWAKRFGWKIVRAEKSK